MATSITASTVSPYTQPQLQDAQYQVSASFPAPNAFLIVSGSTPSLFLPNVGWPTVGRFGVQVYNGALTNTSGSLSVSMSLQESNDNSVWNNIAVFASTLLTAADSGAKTTAASSTTVLLTPNAKPYLRALATVPQSGSVAGGVTGSFGINLLF